MSPEEILICRIFEQASEDYRELWRRNVEKVIDTGGGYSLRDIEIFFNSKWCDRLLEIIDSSLTGKDILSKIRTLCEEASI